MVIREAPTGAAPITGLSHVQLCVTDVSASARWYGVVLGATTYAEDLEIGYVALRQPGAKLVVVLSRRSEDAGGGTEGPLDHLAFAVPDGDALGAWAEHLRAIGIAHEGIVLENGHPSLQLRDPDGIAIELVAP